MSEQARPGDSAAGVGILQATSERIEALLTASAAGGVVARERAEELVRVVVDLYGAGLERLLDVLHDAGRLDQEALDALADDKLVSGLLLVHGLHPHDVPTRVVGALDSVRSYLASHGGDVELIEITDTGVVRLRLTGSCDGCASSATTLELAVDGAVRDAAPEVTDIEVVAASSPPANGVIPVSSLRARTASGSTERAAGWQILERAEDLAEGRADGRLVAGVAVVICRIGTDLFAFRDRCPSCSGVLAGAPLHRRAGAPVGFAVLRCPGCGHHYDVRRAGTCLDCPEESLQPLPLLVRDGQVQIATPAVVMA
jgi:Fe-S cluster biogenesis protein NfuA/nitrite reductase/ring-hydroxylating ferredoxin subunit